MGERKFYAYLSDAQQVKYLHLQKSKTAEDAYDYALKLVKPTMSISMEWKRRPRRSMVAWVWIHLVLPRSIRQWRFEFKRIGGMSLSTSALRSKAANKPSDGKRGLTLSKEKK